MISEYGELLKNTNKNLLYIHLLDDVDAPGVFLHLSGQLDPAGLENKIPSLNDLLGH